MKFMNLLNLTNMAPIQEFYKKVKSRKCLLFKPKFSNLVTVYCDGTWPQMQNFSSISPKLGKPGQKTQGHRV